MKTSTILFAALLSCASSSVTRANLSFQDTQGTVVPAGNGIDLLAKAAPAAAASATTTDKLGAVPQPTNFYDGRPDYNETEARAGGEGAVPKPTQIYDTDGLPLDH